ncbi:hypothetical protein EDEG_00797 [Edhazardia aedis USNM 41457]|uniref:Uncharacterized protein n=1 Tax=Edhazardia aedis (strain USNM 41457) TaxID=1003232 RepID=J9DC83_EDHAE|nr:hypothetical protein EDEG_00797 [Edhazardia aedis USNM 41457]|eukprot:EJW05084.1 hypothetical protein EDEG_00797 [Edhazardia aedis USNM 41457]
MRSAFSLLNIVLFVGISLQRGVYLIKGVPGCPPHRICEVNGLDDVVANSTNLPFLITMLHNNCIPAASVAGWNDHLSYDLVLRKSGNLAPFHPLTNFADHAFCIEKGSGCHRESNTEKVKCEPVDCKPAPCPEPKPVPVPCPPAPEPKPCPEPKPVPVPVPCPPCPAPEPESSCVKPAPKPKPCPPAPKPKPCPPAPKPKPCPPAPEPSEVSEEESGSSAETSEVEHSEESDKEEKSPECPQYVVRRRNIYRNKNREDACNDHVRLAVEDLRVVKTFVFNERDIYNCRKIKVKEVINKAGNVIKWVELKPIFDGKRMTKEGYPALLRFPHFLLELQNYIGRKFKVEKPCLFLDCAGRLYVRLQNTLYMVRFRRDVRFDRKSCFKFVKLCPIRGRALNGLIQKGLAGILFEKSQCEM